MGNDHEDPAVFSHEHDQQLLQWMNRYRNCLLRNSYCKIEKSCRHNYSVTRKIGRKAGRPSEEVKFTVGVTIIEGSLVVSKGLKSKCRQCVKRCPPSAPSSWLVASKRFSPLRPTEESTPLVGHLKQFSISNWYFIQFLIVRIRSWRSARHRRSRECDCAVTLGIPAARFR